MMARGSLAVVIAICLLVDAFCLPYNVKRISRDVSENELSNANEAEQQSSSPPVPTPDPYDDDDDDDDDFPKTTNTSSSGGGSNIFRLLNFASALFPSSATGSNTLIKKLVRDVIHYSARLNVTLRSRDANKFVLHHKSKRESPTPQLKRQKIELNSVGSSESESSSSSDSEDEDEAKESSENSNNSDKNKASEDSVDNNSLSNSESESSSSSDSEDEDEAKESSENSNDSDENKASEDSVDNNSLSSSDTESSSSSESEDEKEIEESSENNSDSDENNAAEESLENSSDGSSSEQDSDSDDSDESDYDSDEPPGGDGQGGGILGLLAGLSGGDDGESDLGTLLQVVSGLVLNLSGDDFDLNSLIASGVGLFAGLLSEGEENPGAILASYLLTSLDVITGGGADNNGAFFGRFVSRLIKGISAAGDSSESSKENRDEKKMTMADSFGFLASLITGLLGDMSKGSSGGSSSK